MSVFVISEENPSSHTKEHGEPTVLEWIECPGTWSASVIATAPKSNSFRVQCGTRQPWEMVDFSQVRPWAALPLEGEPSNVGVAAVMWPCLVDGLLRDEAPQHEPAKCNSAPHSRGYALRQRINRTARHEKT